MSLSDTTSTAGKTLQPSGDSRSSRRQREILDAAAEIFHRKGYSETSVQDIAEAIGILKGSLYYYIDSKEDLLFQMLLEVHEGAKGIVEETEALDVPPIDKLRAYVQRHVEYNAQNLSKIAVYYHDFSLLTAERKKAIMEQRHFYEGFVVGLIEDAKADAAVDKSVDSRLLANAIFGVANWIYTWYQVSGSATPEYLGKLYAEFVVSGITSDQMPSAQPAKVSRGRTSRKKSTASTSGSRS